jgi:mono/diheme cytochrome c family protein
MPADRGPAALALAAGLFGLVACRRAAPVVPEARPSTEEARATYLRACAACHGADGRGGGPVARTLIVPPPDLTRLAAEHGGTFPREHVIAVMAGDRQVPSHGSREMPVWSERFGPPTGATAAAAFYARRRLELVADYLEALQPPSR